MVTRLLLPNMMALMLMLPLASANIILRVHLRAGRLLCRLLPVLSRALSVMQTSNYTFDPLEDMPADFGPRIPAEGVEGFLIVSQLQS